MSNARFENRPGQFLDMFILLGFGRPRRFASPGPLRLTGYRRAIPPLL